MKPATRLHPVAEKASKHSRRKLETDGRHRIMNSPLHHDWVGRSGKPNSTKEEGGDNFLRMTDVCVCAPFDRCSL